MYFHNALRKYGFESFEWSILISDDDSEWIDAAEKLMVKKLGTRYPGGYNLTDGGEGGNGGGYKHSEESKLKMSKSQKGKKRSEEFKKRVSEVHTGRKDSEETRKKRSDAQKKRWQNPTPEMVEQAKENGRKTAGRKQSEEERAMRSAILTGRIVTDETKTKLSASLRGNPKLKAASAANREKRREALRRWNRWRDWESCSV